MVGWITPDKAEVDLTQLKGSTRDHNPLLYLESENGPDADVAQSGARISNWRSHEPTRCQLQSHIFKKSQQGMKMRNKRLKIRIQNPGAHKKVLINVKPWI